MEWLGLVYPTALVHFARNEINKSGRSIARELARATRLGAKKGFPDLMVLFPGAVTVFLEVKAPGNYPTPEQREMHARLEGLGFPVAVVRSIDDVRQAFARWSNYGLPASKEKARL